MSIGVGGIVLSIGVGGIMEISLIPRLLVGGERKSLVSTVRACA